MMKRLVIPIWLAVLANYATAEDLYLIGDRGLWKVVVNSGVPELEEIARFNPGDIIRGIGKTPPGDNGDTDPSNLEDKVSKWADTANEPSARSAFAALYRNNGENFETWETSTSKINVLRTHLLNGAKPIWKEVFKKVDESLESEPKTADTLLKVARGLESATTASIFSLSPITKRVVKAPSSRSIPYMQSTRKEGM